MNEAPKNGRRPFDSIWERILIQLPALAALCWFGYSYLTFSQEMERVRVEKSMVIDAERIDAISKLATAVSALAEYEHRATETTEALLLAIQSSDSSQKSRHEETLRRMQLNNASRTQLASVLTSAVEILKAISQQMTADKGAAD